MPAFMQLLSSCWSERRSLRSKEWQILVLRTAWLNDAPYEWDVNETPAMCFGFGQEEFKAIKEGDLQVGTGSFF